ncbi:hypothetical protein A2960_01520 [Candidatus Gottesmanbacteria bacterium RIFCSPLOWO2_01_FULL_39_12b]|uniref:Uncharacterized protein n=1 Tax=Candidatus Gottesmanbacteria bacterium RIFCSPLOWO2_01_FULL_39_12b TaxID=1798388 RepID=A0A1F6AQ85_9BACT|nr:MAG: hypothetical protein A2960_01520 [Candidatus Gottesmanbacteria bacterium RIFCSPLOWO2_01_FULL_39_12b]
MARLELNFNTAGPGPGGGPLPNESSPHGLSFPSPELREKIGALPSVNCTATQFFGKRPGEIAAHVRGHQSGVLIIDLANVPVAERQNIIAASLLDYDGIKPIAKATLLNEDGKIVRDSDGFTTEDLILRDIVQETLDNPIGKTAFGRFIEALFTKDENRDLVIDEWNKYIVNHSVTGNVFSPLNTHHFDNVGLKTKLKGEDSLRDQVVAFVKGVMGKVKPQAEEIFKDEKIKSHFFSEMNEPDNRLLALGMAELSNFVRGAIFYRIRLGDESLQKYAPRRIAADIIDKVLSE